MSNKIWILFTVLAFLVGVLIMNAIKEVPAIEPTPVCEAITEDSRLTGCDYRTSPVRGYYKK